MLARQTVRLIAPVRIQTRGMATEKQIAMRITSTKNISKITKSMKMVSAAKLKGEQKRLDVGRPFNKWTASVSSSAVPLEGVDVSAFPAKNLVVPMTSDRGLCGGVNTVIARGVRLLVRNMSAQNKDVSMFIMGEKGRSAMRRLFAERIQGVASDVAVPVTFATASSIATEILAHKVDAVHLVFNQFKSVIAYEPSIKTIKPLSDNPAELTAYEVEPERDPEVMGNLYEFLMASQLYHSMLEGTTSEQSARMTAMENASKNAGEMIEKLTLQYNRARQARITTELIEIISGASALEG